MDSGDAAFWLADAGRSLATLGDRLTVRRDGSAVHWSCDGCSAIVELRSDGALDATFIDRPSLDCVSHVRAVPLYRRNGRGYVLSVEGCGRMADDLVDFFSGTREPRFTFVGAHPLVRQRP